MAKIITLITDFRTNDGYMGAVYGVIKSIAPDVEIMTISHSIPPEDIRKGSRALKNSYQFFPDGTIHLVVVDPTVGPHRRGLIVYDGEFYFVGPDNGVFTTVYNRTADCQCFKITNDKYRLSSQTETFHGRDVFAPTAAYLASGIPPEEFGLQIDDPVMLKDPEPEMIGTELIGKIVDIDTFGNLVTNIPAIMVKQNSQILVCGHIIKELLKSYAEVPQKQPLAYIGSIGNLEIAINQGNAANFFGALIFDEVKILDVYPDSE